jgi:ribosomal protein L29
LPKPKDQLPSVLRGFSDAELQSRQRQLVDSIMRSTFVRSLSSAKADSTSVKLMKKERARILTIQRERELDVAKRLARMGQPKNAALMAGRKSIPKKPGRIVNLKRERQLNLPHTRTADELPSNSESTKQISKTYAAPVVSARLLGAEYPMVVGRPYTIVLQREANGIAGLQKSLFGTIGAKASGRNAGRGSGNIDLDVAFRSNNVQIGPEPANHLMKKHSSLAVQIIASEQGEHRLDVFVSVPDSKQLLQVLQVPLVAVLGGGRKR